MCAREIYGMIMVAAMLLMMSCSAEDVVKETTSEEPIAISFSCNYDEEEENTTRSGYQGVMNIEDLHTTGFGVMASVTAGTEAPYDNLPSLMYNQKVAFTLVGDLDPKKGYWSYSPTKYWPNNMEHCYISAYAPYQELPIANPETTTGIYGISANNVEPYVEYRRCEKSNEVVDLMWFFEEPGSIPAAGKLNMKMHHALARLEIKVALASDPGTTKVLIEKITLTGKMAKTGQLSLCSQTTVIENEGTEDEVTKYYPVWSNQEFDQNGSGEDIDHTIQITNVDNDPVSYGIIESQVRYIPGLPYEWQPDGLSTTPQNALNTGDRKGYIYLIPQGTLSLTLTLKYHKVTSLSDETRTKTTTITPTTVANPLKGNTTYTLNLTLSGEL